MQGRQLSAYLILFSYGCLLLAELPHVPDFWAAALVLHCRNPSHTMVIVYRQDRQCKVSRQFLGRLVPILCKACGLLFWVERIQAA